MKCPKCGGRTVKEDFHTYMGQELQLKCIVCGKLFIEAQTPPIANPAVEETPQPSKQSKSLGTCSVCKRPGQYLTRGMCCRDYQAWRKTAAYSFIGPPVPPQESYWKKQVFHPEALADHQAVQSTDSGQVRSGQVRSGQVRSGQAAPLSPDTLLILQIMALKHRNKQAIELLKERACPQT